MVTKSMDFWERTWNSYNRNLDPAVKAVKLLAEYACLGIPAIPRLGLYHGGILGRIFVGHWNTHHGIAAENVVRNFTECSALGLVGNGEAGVRYVLSALKEEINDKEINPEGDLAKVLLVIKNKTGVDYYAIPRGNVDNEITRQMRRYV